MEKWMQDIGELLPGGVGQLAEIGFWLAAFSLLALVVTLLALPYFVAALPEDYFTGSRPTRDVKDYLNLRAIVVLAVKNALGLVLVLAGIAMLVLPGQGLLTLFAGLVLCDFPGKHALTLKLVQQKAVLATLNRMRRARGKAAFRL